MGSVQLSKKTEEMVSKLKIAPTETDEQCIERIMSIAGEDDKDLILTKQDMADIESESKQVKMGNYVTLEQMISNDKIQ